MLKRKDYYKEADIWKEMLKSVLQKSFSKNFLIFPIHINPSWRPFTARLHVFLLKEDSILDFPENIYTAFAQAFQFRVRL